MRPWISQHIKAFLEAVRRIYRDFFSFFTLAIVLGSLAAIPAWLGNIYITAKNTEIPNEIITSYGLVMLKKGYSEAERMLLQKEILLTNISHNISFISKVDALTDLAQLDGLTHLNLLEEDNPLPDALKIEFVENSLIQSEEKFLKQLLEKKIVDSYRYHPAPRVMYKSYIDLLFYLSISLICLTVIGVLTAVFVTNAADAVMNEKRIQLYLFLGASRNYINRPYVYRAILLGGLAGTLGISFLKYFDMLVYLLLGSQLSVLDTGIIEFPIALQIEVMYGVVVGLVTVSWLGARIALLLRLRRMDS